MNEIKTGTVVWIGKPGDPFSKATWTVEAIFEDVDGVQMATLRSGRTGRYATQPLAILTPFRGPHRLTEPAAA
jgi:hypothetical protein